MAALLEIWICDDYISRSAYSYWRRMCKSRKC